MSIKPSELNKEDFYYTVDKKERAEIKVKGSKFIASVQSVASKEEAQKFLEMIKKEFYNSTHNCYAYRFGYDGLEFRSVDDGEPKGTAGKPILFIIKKFDLSDLIVVVTRFFGGTKLGVGGLARAYSDAAEEVLNICHKKIIHRTIPVQVFCTYEDIDVVKKLVSEYAVTFEENYHDAIEINANLPISLVERFTNSLTSRTKGRAGFVIKK